MYVTSIGRIKVLTVGLLLIQNAPSPTDFNVLLHKNNSEKLQALNALSSIIIIFFEICNLPLRILQILDEFTPIFVTLPKQHYKMQFTDDFATRKGTKLHVENVENSTFQ